MKRLITILLLIAMIMTFSIGANATDKEPYMSVSGTKEATETQMELAANLSKDGLAVNRTVEEALATVQGARSTNWIYTDRYFYYYGQEQNYTCGPASVRMALRNITGEEYSESVISAGCNTTASEGTYLADMVTYINSMQNHNTYIAKYKDTKATMKSNLYKGIVNWDAPPIVGLKETTSDGWNYNLGGHFVVVYGVYSNQKKYAVTDPWSGFIGDSANRDITVSVNMMYTAYSAVNIGYMF